MKQQVIEKIGRKLLETDDTQGRMSKDFTNYLSKLEIVLTGGYKSASVIREVMNE